MTRSCPVCGEPMGRIFTATVLGRHSVGYDGCTACGLLQTETPYWLNEAYAEAIAATDTGLVGRNLYNRRRLTPILHRLLRRDARVVDVGGGFGLLTRLLRDGGFDAWSYDPHCRNLLARGFDAVPDERRADALLAFEVMEHVHDPLSFVRSARDQFGGNLFVFSTLPYDGDSPPPLSWWYYSFETGQHVSFFQPRTLRHMAKALDGDYWRISRDLHAFTFASVRQVDRWLLVCDYYLGFYRWWVRWTRRKASLTQVDYEDCRRKLSTTRSTPVQQSASEGSEDRGT